MIAFDSNTFFPYLLQWLEAIAKAGEGAPLKRPLYVINSEAFTIWRKHFGWLRELVNESNEQTGRGWLTSISMSSSRNSLHRSHFHHANNHAPILFPLSQPRRNTLISATSHSSCHDSSSLLPESMHHKLLKHYLCSVKRLDCSLSTALIYLIWACLFAKRETAK